MKKLLNNNNKLPKVIGVITTRYLQRDMNEIWDTSKE